MAFSSNRSAYDAVLAGTVPVMLQRIDGKGVDSPDGIPQWHAERVPVVPGTATPEGAAFYIEPSLEQPEGFYSFSGGMGMRVQDPKRDRDTEGYYHGHWLDASGDIVFNAPKVTQITPATTDTNWGINKTFTASIAGVDYVMALSGRYCLQRTADNAAGWGNISHDFGQYANAVRAEVFNGTHGTPTAYVAVHPPTDHAPAAPTLSTAAAGGTIANGNYTIAVSYVFAHGESLVLRSNSVTAAGGGTSTITINSPAAFPGAIGWYAYVTAAGAPSGTQYRQQAAGSPTNIGTNLTLTAPPSTAGLHAGQTNGYWTWTMETATTTWAQTDQNAIDFQVYRDQLWMLARDFDGNYTVQHCVDGGTSPTFSGEFVMADWTNPCTTFVIHDDRLYVRSQKGLLAVAQGETSAEELTGSMFRFVDLEPNDCEMVSFMQWLLTPLYRTLFAYTVDGNMEEIGLTSLRRNDSPVTGYPTAMGSYGSLYALAAFWNEATSTAYLMKWGNWKVYSTTFQPIPRRVFVPSWIGALWEISNVKIQSLGISEAAGGPYVYMGLENGDIAFYRLPRNGPDATADTTWTQFNTDNPFQLYTAAITRGNPGLPKAFTGIEITGQNLNAAVSYRTNRTGAFGGSANLENNGVFNSDPGGRNSFTTSVLTRWLDLLVTGTATDVSTPCIVETVAAWSVPRPPFKWVFTFKMYIGSRVMNKYGNIITDYDTTKWIDSITSMCETGAVDFLTPDGHSYLALVTNFKLDPRFVDLKGVDIEYIGTVEVMQLLPKNNQGQHAHLASYDHVTLATYTHAELVTL